MTPEAGRSVVTLRWALAAPGSVEAVRAVLAALVPLGGGGLFLRILAGFGLVTSAHLVSKQVASIRNS